MKKYIKLKKNYFSCFILIILLLYSLVCLKSTYNTTISESYIEDDEWIPVKDIEISTVTNDIIGYLSIPKFNNEYYINMPIKEGVELPILATAIGHFPQTSYNIGNVCLVAHNSGTNKNGNYVGFFDTIKNLEKEDIIIYKYLDNTYIYKVISNQTIKETDMSILNSSEDNLLTLITCVKGKENRNLRICIVAQRI